MKIKRLFSTLFLSGILTACQSESVHATSTAHRLAKWTHHAGKIRQITADKTHLYLINEKGELWQNQSKQAHNFSTYFQAIAQNGALASADSQGFLTVWTPTQHYRSRIPLARDSGLVWVNETCLVGIHQAHYPIRVCLQNNDLKIKNERRDIRVLPDARPVAWENQVAILANPDDKTYRHGVLGDAIEARSLVVLNGQDLSLALPTIHLDKNHVFENNTVFVQNHQIMTVVSGGGLGAKAVLWDAKSGKKLAESTPLPSNRWQSPFGFNGQWFAVQMPHLMGKLVRYDTQNHVLKENFLADRLSNHAIGARDTQIAVITNEAVWLPKMAYRQMRVFTKNGQIQNVLPELPSPMIRGISLQNQAYFLLENGEIWVGSRSPKSI